MNNILKTPLSQETISVLLTMGVQLYSDSETGSIHVHRRYWGRISVPLRQALVRIILAMEGIEQAGEVANV